MDRDEKAEAALAQRYRREAADFRAEAIARYPESPEDARGLERVAADLIVLAASIERSLLGIDPLPATGLG